jgi:hypothetical protein
LKETAYMENILERLTTGISRAEIEGRWNAVRELIRDRKLHFLLMRNDEGFQGGQVNRVIGKGQGCPLPRSERTRRVPYGVGRILLEKDW